MAVERPGMVVLMCRLDVVLMKGGVWYIDAVVRVDIEGEWAPQPKLTSKRECSRCITEVLYASGELIAFCRCELNIELHRIICYIEIELVLRGGW